MILTFKSVDKTLWCYCSDETSLAEHLNSNYYVPLRIFQNELSFQPVLNRKDKSLWNSSLQVQASLLAAWDVSQGRHQQFRPQNSILMTRINIYIIDLVVRAPDKFVRVLRFSSLQKDIFPVVASLHPKSKCGTLLISQSLSLALGNQKLTHENSHKIPAQWICLQVETTGWQVQKSKFARIMELIDKKGTKQIHIEKD